MLKIISNAPVSMPGRPAVKVYSSGKSRGKLLHRSLASVAVDCDVPVQVSWLRARRAGRIGTGIPARHL